MFFILYFHLFDSCCHLGTGLGALFLGFSVPVCFCLLFSSPFGGRTVFSVWLCLQLQPPALVWYNSALLGMKQTPFHAQDVYSGCLFLFTSMFCMYAAFWVSMGVLGRNVHAKEIWGRILFSGHKRPFAVVPGLSEKDTEGCPHIRMYLQTPMWAVHSLLLLQTAAGKEFLKPGGCLCQSLQLLCAHYGARANNRLKILIVISAMGLQVHLWSQLVYVMRSDWLNS